MKKAYFKTKKPSAFYIAVTEEAYETAIAMLGDSKKSDITLADDFGNNVLMRLLIDTDMDYSELIYTLADNNNHICPTKWMDVNPSEYRENTKNYIHDYNENLSKIELKKILINLLLSGNYFDLSVSNNNGYNILSCLLASGYFYDFSKYYPDLLNKDIIENTKIKKINRNVQTGTNEVYEYNIADMASLYGNIGVLKILGQYGYDFNRLNLQHRTPLSYAKKKDVFDYIINAGGDIDLPLGEKKNLNLLYYYSGLEQTYFVKEMIADLESRKLNNKNSATLPHDKDGFLLSTKNYTKTEYVKKYNKLFKKTLACNIKTEAGTSAIRFAIVNGKFSIATFLLSYGATMMDTNNKGIPVILSLINNNVVGSHERMSVVEFKNKIIEFAPNLKETALNYTYDKKNLLSLYFIDFLTCNSNKSGNFEINPFFNEFNNFFTKESVSKLLNDKINEDPLSVLYKKLPHDTDKKIVTLRSAANVVSLISRIEQEHPDYKMDDKLKIKYFNYLINSINTLKIDDEHGEVVSQNSYLSLNYNTVTSLVEILNKNNGWIMANHNKLAPIKNDEAINKLLSSPNEKYRELGVLLERFGLMAGLDIKRNQTNGVMPHKI